MKMRRKRDGNKPELCKSCSSFLYLESCVRLRKFNIQCKPDEVLRVWLSLNCAIVKQGSPPAGYDDVIYGFRVDLAESGIRSGKPPRPETWEERFKELHDVYRRWRRSK